MTNKPDENNIPEDEIKSLKEELNELKKKQEFENLKEEVDSLKNQKEVDKKKKEIESLKAEVASISSQSPQNSDPSWDDVKSKRTTAGVLGIIFGAFGVHKFILGYQTEGFIYLATTIVGGVITCGLAWAVTSIICIVEGIIYLTKTPEEFKRLYIDKKTGWF